MNEVSCLERSSQVAEHSPSSQVYRRNGGYQYGRRTEGLETTLATGGRFLYCEKCCPTFSQCAIDLDKRLVALNLPDHGG